MTAWTYARLPNPLGNPVREGGGGDKWHARYKQVGFDNLDDMPHTGRPSKVDKAVMKKIRKNACRKLIWTGREMQDYILKHSGTKYYITHMSAIC